MALAGCPDSFLHRPYYQVWGSVGGCRLHGQWLRATAQMELVTAIHSVTGCGWTGAAGTSRRGSHVCHGCLHLVLRGLSPVLSVRGLSPVLSVRGTLSSSSLLLLCGFACDPRDGVFRGGRLLGPRAQVAGAVAPSGTSSGGTASWARSGERVGSGPRRGLSEMESPPSPQDWLLPAPSPSSMRWGLVQGTARSDAALQVLRLPGGSPLDTSFIFRTTFMFELLLDCVQEHI